MKTQKYVINPVSGRKVLAKGRVGKQVLKGGKDGGSGGDERPGGLLKTLEQWWSPEHEKKQEPAQIPEKLQRIAQAIKYKKQ